MTNSDLIIQECIPETLSKSSIQEHSSNIVKMVESGNISALGAATKLSYIIEVCKQAKDSIRDYAVDEVSKWDKNEPCIVNGATIAKTSKGDWDFSECNDDELNTLEMRFEMLKEKVKERKEFLKALTKPTTIVDEETGNIATVNPAKNNSESIIKITFKP